MGLPFFPNTPPGEEKVWFAPNRDVVEVMKLTQIEMAKSFGLEVVFEDRGKLVGASPSTLTSLSFDDRTPLIVTSRYVLDTDVVFHELCHALAGPEALEEEGFMLPMQWELMKRLTPLERVVCRRAWGNYLLYFGRGWKRDMRGDRSPTVSYDSSVIESFPSWKRSRSWRECVALAKGAGLLTAEGKLPSGLSIPIRAWQNFLDPGPAVV